MPLAFFANALSILPMLLLNQAKGQLNFSGVLAPKKNDGTKEIIEKYHILKQFWNFVPPENSFLDCLCSNAF